MKIQRQLIGGQEFKAQVRTKERETGKKDQFVFGSTQSLPDFMQLKNLLNQKAGATTEKNKKIYNLAGAGLSGGLVGSVFGAIHGGIGSLAHCLGGPVIGAVTGTICSAGFNLPDLLKKEKGTLKNILHTTTIAAGFMGGIGGPGAIPYSMAIVAVPLSIASVLEETKKTEKNFKE